MGQSHELSELNTSTKLPFVLKNIQASINSVTTPILLQSQDISLEVIPTLISDHRSGDIPPIKRGELEQSLFLTKRQPIENAC